MRPWRTGDPEPRPAVATPPGRMPLLQGGRPLKQWHYVGVYGPAVMLCAAVARVGVARLGWWAVWDRTTRTLAEASYHRTGPVRLGPERLTLEDGPVRVELELEPGTPVETISPHGTQHIWTRKAPVRARGSVVVAERRHEIDAHGLTDESAGYHARRTAWLWSAGVGTVASGEPVAWNLVTGVHDDPSASERTVWVDGVPHHVPPQRFDGLAAVGDLRFRAEATRARRENLLLLVSEYEQPFGAFEGELPVAGPLRDAYGVMERHAVRW